MSGNTRRQAAIANKTETRLQSLRRVILSSKIGTSGHPFSESDPIVTGLGKCKSGKNPIGCSARALMYLRHDLVSITDALVFTDVRVEETRVNQDETEKITLAITKSTAIARTASSGWNDTPEAVRSSILTVRTEQFRFTMATSKPVAQFSLAHAAPSRHPPCLFFGPSATHQPSRRPFLPAGARRPSPVDGFYSPVHAQPLPATFRPAHASISPPYVLRHATSTTPFPTARRELEARSAPIRHNGVYASAFKPARREFHVSSTQQKDHRFDTLKLVQRLKSEGFSEEQAVALMRVLNDVIEESIRNLTRTMVLREDAERSAYTQKVDFAKLRSELLNSDSTEAQLTRSSHDRIAGDLAKLNSRLRDEITRTQASVRLDLNLEKGRIREEANGQEMRIKETETRIEQEVAGLRERVEAVKFSTLQWLMVTNMST
ncbi:Protein fmp32, mitochondrial [Ophidiomyces ophidiicola]|nr:Protein fmp32, mitochondrial [Ophidiomyces ophidiicola]KAI2068439.1 Protein fmp32, mitochondrial [Ophidiomyces ophidiicola]KAI2130086.1 Protein fmp32, mitochondrial [Ophidiomyces ophidiicola]KAI2140696.1 Protein fmp32, mitochondrial [Ophidiomyces ophidiicola]KAI2261708.1 Protein fmp32, mitochondrial [Ophidiomyces ophidiicola]